MEKRSLFVILVLSCVMFFRAGPAHAETLDDLIEEALKNNPQVQEAYHRWKAEEYKIKSVKSLDDPMLSYGYFGEEVQTRVGPQNQKYGVSQKFPFPGKRALKAKAQRKQAESAREQYEAVKHKVVQDIKAAYYDLFWVDHAIAISEEQQGLLEKSENAAQRRYESNLMPQQNVVKVQIELSNIANQLALFRQNRLVLAAKINTLINREQNTPVDPVLDIAVPPFTVSLDDLLARASDSRQELVAAGLAVEKAEYEKSLAKMNYLPDVTIGAEYIEIGGGTTTSIDDGQDAWAVMASVNVPLWFGKLRAQVHEKDEQLKAAQTKKTDMGNMVELEVRDIFSSIKAYQGIVNLYETALIPQAEQAFNTSHTGFETGTISFIDWLDAERTYLQTRLAYYKSIADYLKSIAYLERIIGSSIN